VSKWLDAFTAVKALATPDGASPGSPATYELILRGLSRAKTRR